jgi:hypothetical protein
MNRGPLMRMVHGALAGIDGAATMTVLRMAAHRVGLIDQMVPQKVEQWTRSRRRRRSPGTARVVEHVLHLGYGASWGALFGLIAGRERPTALRVVGFGVGLWGLGALVLFPSPRHRAPGVAVVEARELRQRRRTPRVRADDCVSRRGIRQTAARRRDDDEPTTRPRRVITCGAPRSRSRRGDPRCEALHAHAGACTRRSPSQRGAARSTFMVSSGPNPTTHGERAGPLHPIARRSEKRGRKKE